MKRILSILLIAFTLGSTSFAQDGDAGGKLRDKMVEYIQNKLGMSKAEAERFQPVFLDYLKDLRDTKQQYKGDRLVLQQKVVDLRIRYRDQFKPIIGEARSNAVFKHERDFVEKVQQEIIDRRENHRNGRANKKTGLLQ